VLALALVRARMTWRVLVCDSIVAWIAVTAASTLATRPLVSMIAALTEAVLETGLLLPSIRDDAAALPIARRRPPSVQLSGHQNLEQR
jgi:hypothetical protein